MHPIKSVFAGLIVGLIARDLSLLSAAFLTLFFALVLFVWDLIRFVAEEGAFFTKAGRSGKMALFLIGADGVIIALVGALTYWGIGWLRASP